MKKLLFRVCFLSLLVAAMIGGVFAAWSWRNARETRIVFLDVGQGDAILVTQGSNQILIDGGRSGKTLLAGVARHVPFWDRTIEAVVATHPDADHIGGLPELIRRYEVPAYVATTATSDSEVFESLVSVLGTSPVTETVPARRELAFAFPSGGRLVVLYPSVDPPGSSANDGSVVARFTFGETDILLTGDLPKEETHLPDVGDVEILKVSHHGSKHSTSAAFLAITRPEEAVISVGKNSYGHPDAEVLARLAASGASVRRTDRQGDVVYRCQAAQNGCVFAGPTR